MTAKQHCISVTSCNNNVVINVKYATSIFIKSKQNISKQQKQ